MSFSDVSETIRESPLVEFSSEFLYDTDGVLRCPVLIKSCTLRWDDDELRRVENDPQDGRNLIGELIREHDEWHLDAVGPQKWVMLFDPRQDGEQETE